MDDSFVNQVKPADEQVDESKAANFHDNQLGAASPSHL